MNSPITIKDILSRPCGHLNQHLLKDQPEKKKRSKYNNVRVEFDGQTFDSKKELDRFITLRMLQISGEIKDLQCQVEFILEAEDKKVCAYVADFVFTDLKTDRMVVEDVKSPATRKLAVYRLKKKLMQNCLNIEIKEI